jgi:hypothetical protein
MQTADVSSAIAPISGKTTTLNRKDTLQTGQKSASVVKLVMALLHSMLNSQTLAG